MFHDPAPMKLTVGVERWPLRTPFRITGHTWHELEVLLVTLERNGSMGQGEAAGVYFKGETAATMRRQVEAARARIEDGVAHQALRGMLPPGGARNALDCALWDLEAKLSGHPVWRLAGVREPRPLLTMLTCGANTPERMAATACRYETARAIKLKLTGEPQDAERVRAVRAVKPTEWLSVDANQGFTLSSLERLMPVLVDAGVALIEQPFPVGQEALLDGFQSPIPIAADESIVAGEDIRRAAGRFQMINVKLDKAGGLTDGLKWIRLAHAEGLDATVGNMFGTSLAMAPGFVLGQLCEVVDLDGPLFLRTDRDERADYTDGYIDCSKIPWGSATRHRPA
jgi:L-Ala-D/L-Glu epimerase